jgi:hypothetical protein
MISLEFSIVPQTGAGSNDRRCPMLKELQDA